MTIKRKIDYTCWALGSAVREFHNVKTRITVCRICQRLGEEVTDRFLKTVDEWDYDAACGSNNVTCRRWVHVAADVDYFGQDFRIDIDSCEVVRHARESTGRMDLTAEECLEVLARRGT